MGMSSGINAIIFVSNNLGHILKATQLILYIKDQMSFAKDNSICEMPAGSALARLLRHCKHSDIPFTAKSTSMLLYEYIRPTPPYTFSHDFYHYA